MKIKDLNQIEFSSILFDTLFGLILFFNIDSFLDIKTPTHFLLYLFSMFILIHWWLVFKSADDAFESEVTDSAADLVFGIVDVILLDYIILLSRTFSYQQVAIFTIALLSVDFLWALIWRFVGSWNTKDKVKIKAMQTELNHNIFCNLITLFLLCSLVLFTSHISSFIFISLFIMIYSLYIILTFIYKIIDIHIF